MPTTRNISATLQCFIKKGDKYLILHRASHKKIMPNVWMAPGGKRECNEGLFECARREVMEETGLRIKNLRVKAIGNAYLEDINLDLYFHFVVADYAGGRLKRNEQEEDGDFKWLTVDGISKLDNLLAEIKHVAPYIFDDSNRIISYKSTYKVGNEMAEFVLEES